MKRKTFFRNRAAALSPHASPELGRTKKDFLIKKVLLPLIVLGVLFFVCLILLTYVKMSEQQNNRHLSHEGFPQSAQPAEIGENP